ncbi:MAG: SAM-dependent methyltransferase [Pseudomonadota bacterium]
MTTPLDRLVRARIAQTGPIRLADFMSDCLMHPQHGYYTQETVFGAQGDFVTAPDVSQMFGELIGLALAQSWIQQGQPHGACLVELGPGRGTLMADIKRAARSVPGFDDLPVHMVEQSPQLRALQAQAVPGVIHHATVDDLPDAPLFLVANEFFDALPIRQFKRAAAGWQECQVGVVDDALTAGWGPPGPVEAVSHRSHDTNPGDIVEHCPALPRIIQALSDRIARNDGAALIIDYGDWQSLGDTVQAVQNHKSVPWLTDPGRVDITAHVAFQDIARAAGPLTASQMIPQGIFLERLGITARAQSLAQRLGGRRLDQHIAAHRRLTHPDEMGNLFKVVGLVPSRHQLPPGLDPLTKG